MHSSLIRRPDTVFRTPSNSAFQAFYSSEFISLILISLLPPPDLLQAAKAFAKNLPRLTGFFVSKKDKINALYESSASLAHILWLPHNSIALEGYFIVAVMSRIPPYAGFAPLGSDKTHPRPAGKQLESKEKENKRQKLQQDIQQTAHQINALGEEIRIFESPKDEWPRALEYLNRELSALRQRMDQLSESADLDLIETIIREEEFDVADRHLAAVFTRRPRDWMTSIRHAHEFTSAQRTGYEEFKACSTVKDATATSEEEDDDVEESIRRHSVESGRNHTPPTNDGVLNGPQDQPMFQSGGDLDQAAPIEEAPSGTGFGLSSPRSPASADLEQVQRDIPGSYPTPNDISRDQNNSTAKVTFDERSIENTQVSVGTEDVDRGASSKNKPISLIGWVCQMFSRFRSTSPIPQESDHVDDHCLAKNTGTHERGIADTTVAPSIDIAPPKEPRTRKVIALNRAAVFSANARKLRSRRPCPEPDPSNSPAAQCLGCLELFTLSKLVPLSCNHLYCQSCLIDRVDLAIREESYWPAKCCERIWMRSVYRALPRDIIKRYHKKSLEWATNASERVYCHDSDCAKKDSGCTFIDPKTIGGQFAYCPDCTEWTCIFCKGSDHYGPCPPSRDEMFRQAAEIYEWATCPKCSMTVEIKDGCNHMM